MEGRDFIKVIKEVVRDSSIISTIRNLELPPGRKPSEELVALSGWYKQLGNTDKEMIKKIIYAVADSSVFGFVAVLDGVRVIEDTSEKWEFELYYINNKDRKLLNRQEDEYLHDMYKSLG